MTTATEAIKRLREKVKATNEMLETCWPIDKTVTISIADARAIALDILVSEVIEYCNKRRKGRTYCQCDIKCVLNENGFTCNDTNPTDWDIEKVKNMLNN